MHAVTVTLSQITFFVTKNYNIVIFKTSKNTTRIVDNMHNNGGWEVTEKYDDVIAKFAQAYAQLT